MELKAYTIYNYQRLQRFGDDAFPTKYPFFVGLDRLKGVHRHALHVLQNNLDGNNSQYIVVDV